MEITPVFKRQRNYKFDKSAQKKLILLASQTSSAAVFQEYGIPKRTFSGWKNKLDMSLDYEKGQFTLHPGRKSLGSHLDLVIDKFIESHEQGQMECTVNAIVFEIFKFDNQFMDLDFGKTRKWVYRYLERNHYSIRNKTHVAQKPCDVEVCLDFLMYANDIKELFNIHPDFIINMDETPCYFDNWPSKKVVSKGAKTVNGAKTMGLE